MTEKIYAVRSVGINNSKVVNKLKATAHKLSAGSFNVYLGKGRLGQKVNIELKVIDKKLGQGSLHKEYFLDYMDFLILDAAQLFLEPPLSEKYGKCFTARKLIKVMTGGECGGNGGKQTAVSKTKINEITERIRYLSNIRIKIRKCTSVGMNADGDLEETLDEAASGRLLPVDCRSSEGRAEEFCFAPDAEMPLRKFASTSRHIIRADADLFFCNGVVRNTDMNLIIKYYLIHEIMVMKYRKRHEDGFAANRIYYTRSDGTGLLSVIGFASEDKNAVLNKISAVNETVCSILEYYRKKGFIEGFCTFKYSENGGVKGVEVQLAASD